MDTQRKQLDPEPISILALAVSVVGAGISLYSAVEGRSQRRTDEGRRANRLRIQRILSDLSINLHRCEEALTHFLEHFGEQLAGNPVQFGLPLYLEDNRLAQMYVAINRELADAVEKVHNSSIEFVEEMYNSFDALEWKESPLATMIGIRNDANKILYDLRELDYSTGLKEISRIIDKLTHAVADTRGWLEQY